LNIRRQATIDRFADDFQFLDISPTNGEMAHQNARFTAYYHKSCPAAHQGSLTDAVKSPT